MKKISSTLSLIAFAFLVTILVSSCGKEKVHKNIICYVDFSENPNRDKRVAYYVEVINNSIIKNMSFNDRIVILPIDNGTITNNIELLDKSLNKQFDYIPDGTSPLDEDRVAQENLDKDIKAMTDEFNANITKAITDRANLTKGTDILGALNGVGTYYQAGQKNIVVLLSDMMNWSSNLKMEQGSFTANLVDKKLAELPTLDGQKAIVLVHTGDITNISNDHYNSVNGFWKKYFDKYNFSLNDYSSSGKSKLEEIIKTPIKQ
jgi:hypothetical protein